MKPQPTLRTLTLADGPLLDQANDLLNRTQGIGLFPADYVQTLIPRTDAYVVAAFIDGNLTGVGVAQVIDNFEYYVPFVSNICSELATKRVGSFSTLAVSEKWQGHGIGQAISRERMKWVKDQGCEVVVGVSWVSGLAHTSNRVFEKMGFRPIQRLEGFYRESSIEKPFDCPGCKAAPCECGAILYRFDF